MKRRIIFAVALIMVACLAVTGCGKKTESQEILLTNEQSDGQAEIPVSQTATPEPAEYFSETPESLDGTAWILDNNPNQKERAAFFFKDGLVTYVSRDEIYKDSYRYKNNVLITDEINIGIVGDVNGGRLINVTYYGNPYPDMIRVEPSRAVQYVRELHPDFESPFDDGAEPASDTGYTSTDNSDPRFENGQYIYVVAGKEIRLSVNVWDYVKIGSAYKRLDWKGLLEHYGYDKPNTTHSQYMKLDNGERVEIGYGYREQYVGYSNVYIIFCAAGGTIMEKNPDFSDGYLFDKGENLPGNITGMILLAYTAEQMLNNPNTDPYASLFGEYRVESSSAEPVYAIP